MQIQNISAALAITQAEAMKPSAQGINVAVSAISSPSNAVTQINKKTEQVAGWMLEVDGKRFGINMVEGKLVVNQFEAEYQEYLGSLASTMDEAINLVKAGNQEFCLVQNEGNSNFVYTMVYMLDEQVVTRQVKFTQYGVMNGTAGQYDTVQKLHENSLKYKYGTPVAAF